VGTFLDRFHDGADKAFGWNGLQVEVSDQFVRVRTIEIRATAAEFMDPFNGSREAHQEVSGLEDLFHPVRGLGHGGHGSSAGGSGCGLSQHYVGRKGKAGGRGGQGEGEKTIGGGPMERRGKWERVKGYGRMDGGSVDRRDSERAGQSEVREVRRGKGGGMKSSGGRSYSFA
jgi:hypothetical protein